MKNNFPNVPYSSFGLESKTIIILNYENNKIVGCVCLLNNRLLKDLLTKSKVDLDDDEFLKALKARGGGA